MAISLYKLKRVKPFKVDKNCTPMLLVGTFASIVAPAAFCQSKGLSPASIATPKVTLMVGVLDEEKLSQARSDFPALSGRVLPQVIAKRKLTLVVSKQGLRWGGAQMTRVDVTPDVLALLRTMPVTTASLTGPQTAAAQKAIDALNALRVATTIDSVSYDDYRTRLTNTSITVDASLRALPPGPLRDQIDKAMKEFANALSTWDSRRAIASIDDQALGLEFQLRRRQLPSSSDLSRLLLDIEENTAREKKRQETFKPIYDVWANAAQYTAAAEKLLPKPTTP